MAKQKINREELAWAAGFFDGEGCTTVSAHKNGPRKGYKNLHITVAQTDKRPLERLLSIWKKGKIYGPYTRKNNPRVSPYYKLNISGLENVNKVISSMWPWLGDIKREQAIRRIEEMTEYCNRPNKKTGPKPILNEQEIIEVKFLIGKIPTREIAFLYGISMETVWTIRSKGVKYAK